MVAPAPIPSSTSEAVSSSSSWGSGHPCKNTTNASTTTAYFKYWHIHKPILWRQLSSVIFLNSALIHEQKNSRSLIVKGAMKIQDMLRTSSSRNSLSFMSFSLKKLSHKDFSFPTCNAQTSAVRRISHSAAAASSNQLKKTIAANVVWH
jgi:hypothetical protein